jgi:hypothetical protein
MTGSHGRLPSDQQIWIVFAGSPPCVVRRLPWLKLFRRDFRHCFAAVRDSCGWLAVDPLCGRLVVARLSEDPLADLPGQFSRRGMRVLGPFRPGPPTAQFLPPLAPFTCVTACLRLLGRRAPLVLTPWQLFRHLEAVRAHIIGNNA